jgi:outer membrane protein assembly factor BamD (BamD/ComL family)
VIEHAPFGPLADDAVYAIGEAYYRQADYERALEHYERLIKQYRDSALLIRARVRRAACNAKLSEGAPYDLEPAEQAKKDMDLLVRLSGDEELAGQAREMRDVLARSDYETGLFYFERRNIHAGIRYLGAVVARYPESEYAKRARRILEEAIIARYPGSEHTSAAKRALAKARGTEGKEER